MIGITVSRRQPINILLLFFYIFTFQKRFIFLLDYTVKKKFYYYLIFEIKSNTKITYKEIKLKYKTGDIIKIKFSYI